MSELVQILISIVVVATGTVFISQKFKLSKRYERQSKKAAPLNSWSALDQGIDPSRVEEEKL
ncbi:MAG: hypothetical protein RJA40_424 [Actinomycetota bacterium]|jgi:hypothetical protein